MRNLEASSNKKAEELTKISESLEKLGAQLNLKKNSAENVEGVNTENKNQPPKNESAEEKTNEPQSEEDVFKVASARVMDFVDKRIKEEKEKLANKDYSKKETPVEPEEEEKRSKIVEEKVAKEKEETKTEETSEEVKSTSKTYVAGTTVEFTEEGIKVVENKEETKENQDAVLLEKLAQKHLDDLNKVENLKNERETLVNPKGENAPKRKTAKEEKQKEKTTQQGEETPEGKEEIPLEKQLDDARQAYASAFKDFKKQSSSWFSRNITHKIFGFKAKESKIPQSLKDLEKGYDKLAVEYGKKMYADKKTELEKSDKPKEEQEKELLQYKQKEIFKRVVIEEQQKLNTLKVENLPPKEKNLLKRALDGYLKLPKGAKIAISVTLSLPVIYLITPGAVAAAGGVAFYATKKFARATAGSFIGQMATKGYDRFVKERYTERKEKSLKELQGKFQGEMTNAELSDYKKQYAEILEKEQKAKRNRIIHKAMIAITAGGLTSYGTSQINLGGHHLTPEDILKGKTPSGTGVEGHTTTSSGVHRTNLSDQIKARGRIEQPIPKTEPGVEIKTEEVNYSSRGAIQTIEDLKAKIKADYPDITKAPKNIQDFLKTDSTQEAIKLGMYDPANPNESMIVQKGTLTWDENGNLKTHYVDMKGTEHDQIMIKGETVEQYKGEMFDSGDNSGINKGDASFTENQTSASTASTHTEAESPLKGATLDQDKIIAPKPIIKAESPLQKITTQTTTQTSQGGVSTSETTKAFGQDGKNVTTTIKGNEIITDNNPFHLSAETLKLVDQVNKDNINHLFPTNESLTSWETIKSSSNLTAERMLQVKSTDTLPIYKPVVEYIQKLHTITGLKPVGATITTVAETNEDYIERALQKAAEMGQLDKVKL